MGFDFLFENPNLILPRQEAPQNTPRQEPLSNREPKSTLELASEEVVSAHESSEEVVSEEDLAPPAVKEEEEDSFESRQAQIRKDVAKIHKTKTSPDSKFYSHFIPSNAKRNRK